MSSNKRMRRLIIRSMQRGSCKDSFETVLGHRNAWSADVTEIVVASWGWKPMKSKVLTTSAWILGPSDWVGCWGLSALVGEGLWVPGQTMSKWFSDVHFGWGHGVRYGRILPRPWFKLLITQGHYEQRIMDLRQAHRYFIPLDSSPMEWNNLCTVWHGKPRVIS